MPPLTLDPWDQAALTAQVKRRLTTAKENTPAWLTRSLR